MEQLFKQAFEKGLLTEAGEDFGLWWDTVGKKLSDSAKDSLLYEVLKRGTGK